MTPLVRAVLIFAAGLLAGLRLDVPRGALLLACCAMVTVAAWLALPAPPALLIRHAQSAGAANARASARLPRAQFSRLWPALRARARARPQSAVPDLALVFVLFAALGVLAGSAASLQVRTDCRAALPDGANVAVRGTLEGAPRPGDAAWLRLESVRVGAREIACTGALRVRLPSRGSTPGAGARVSGTGTWWAFPRAAGWPEPPERGGTLGLRSVRVLEHGRGATLLASARGRAQESARRLFPRKGGLAEALVLAERGGIEAEVRQDFAAAGLMHLLSISGTHVGLVAAVLLLAGAVLRLPIAWAAPVAALATIAYVLFLGAPHAASRAALQIVLLLAARLAQRPSDPYTLLAFAALVLLVVDPLAVLGAGFQLSFAGIFGLLSLRRPLLGRMPARLPRWLRDGLASGTAATLATMPIAALHFGLVSWIGVLANLVAMPLVALAVPAIAIAMLVATLHDAAGAFLGAGGDLVLGALEHVARVAAAAPLGHAYVSRATVLVWLAAVAASIMVAGVMRRAARQGAGASGETARVAPGGDAAGRSFVARRRLPIHWLAGAGAGFVVLLAGPALPRAGGGNLEIHAIDVGQGDALAIRSPAGHWIVVDTGMRSDDFDAGLSRVVPFLRDKGARRVDALILTHPHADHIGGALAVLDAFDVGVIIDPAVAAGSDLYAQTLAHAARKGIRWVAAAEGRELRVGDVAIHVLAPLETALDARADPNDYSAVFRLAYGRFGALFLGDAPMQVENELVARHGASLAVQLLKVGHHGSHTSTGDSLLAAIQPALALVSAGRRNRYGHPDPGVLARLGRHNVRVLRTDERGTISVRVDARGEMTATSTR